MRAPILPAAALALAVALVLAGGRMAEGPPAFDLPGPDDFAIADDPLASIAPEAPASPIMVERSAPVEPEAAVSGLPQAEVEPSLQPDAIDAGAPKETAASRLVAPAVVAPPVLAPEELQRDAPREPLSRLSLALPPPPPPEFSNPWAGKPLFRPVAVESAVFESGGHTIAIDGVKSVAADESCAYEGEYWSCGIRARAAFRLWLRGRALVCQIPGDEQDQAAMRGKCRLAKQDVGAWLVENGWALAEPDGPYAQAGEKARAARLGIFGPPPDTSSVPDVPDVPTSAAAGSQPVMAEEGVDPQPSADPRMAFPPAPSAP